VKDLQLQLKAAGCDPCDIDGIFGRNTQVVLKTFQERYAQLADTGILDP
jgi:peptidoglycan hydrolase-like protein with peptidoglycan-binding domain